ncbi:MAG: (4Fe-4S)-binding protein, partial [Anaerolineae bacterium]|nr:(4Fe-4S)-binding protein [Anaerolineae bacterium]
GDEGVQAYCEREHIPILMRIPLKQNIAQGISNGVPFIQIEPEYESQFVELWNNLTHMVR